MKPFPRNPAKILIRSTNWIGDAVMTTPAVRSIRENFPDSELSLLVLPWVSDVFRHSPRIDRILTYDRNGRHKGVAGKWRLGRELAGEGFDCAILLQNAFEAAFITTVAGIPVRGGYTTDGRGLLLTHGVKKHPDIKTKHQVHYYQEMLQGLGLETGDNQLELFIPDDIRASAGKRIEAMTGRPLGERPLIGLNPGAAYGPAKKWPAAKYGGLAGMLFAEEGADIAVFGTDADNQAARTISDAAGEACTTLDFTGKTSLMEAMALMSCCDAFVTNDSGLMHVAAALRVPQVAVFGSTDHIATGPFSDNALIVRNPMDCSPCLKPECPKQHLRCLEQISVPDVFDKVHQLLATN